MLLYHTVTRYLPWMANKQDTNVASQHCLMVGVHFCLPRCFQNVFFTLSFENVRAPLPFNMLIWSWNYCEWLLCLLFILFLWFIFKCFKVCQMLVYSAHPWLSINICFLWKYSIGEAIHSYPVETSPLKWQCWDYQIFVWHFCLTKRILKAFSFQGLWCFILNVDLYSISHGLCAITTILK